MDNDEKKGGVNRTHGQSTAEKIYFSLGHLLVILVCTWLLLLHGLTHLGNLVGQHWTFADTTRAAILLACAFIYWIRHAITLFYLIQRKVDWSEAMGLLVFIGSIELGLLLLGGGAFRQYSIDLGWLDMVALILLIAGSFLNSFSEIQRKWWKSNPANKGHCYIQGLFKYAMHINYFGDTVLFTGWCLFTHNFWTLGLPLLMALSFIFFHIPGLDSYLSDRYGDEFRVYSEETKKFIPFIY